MLGIASRLSTAVSCAVIAAYAGAAAAQAENPASYPSKAVRMIVGFTPGSATDVIGRIFAQKFTEAWGQTVAVDNVPGLGGGIGMQRLTKSPADGYTIMFSGNGAPTILNSLQPKPLYDVLRETAPAAMVLMVPSILAVNNDVPAKTLQEFIAYAKSMPKKLSYASPGAGTPQHITGELLKGMAGIDIAHIPYKGAVLTDVIGGRVAMTLQNAGAILPMVREGKLRGLAVTSLMRSPNIPELPSIAESGFPGFEAISWFAIYAPAGTPVPIINKIYQESIKVVGNAEMKAKFAQLALDPYPRTGAETATIMKTDIEKWAKVIKDAGITMAE